MRKPLCARNLLALYRSVYQQKRCFQGHSVRFGVVVRGVVCWQPWKDRGSFSIHQSTPEHLISVKKALVVEQELWVGTVTAPFIDADAYLVQ